MEHRSHRLTPNQWGMVFLDQVEPGSAMYDVMWTCAVDGPLDVDLLRTALTAVTRRHEALRTRFELSGDMAEAGRQIVDDEPRVDLALVPAPPGEAGRDTGLEYREELARLVEDPPFVLTEGPLFRVRVLRYTPVRHRLVLNFHHLVFDGWSVGVFLNDLAVSYGDLARGGTGELPALGFGYVDYVRLQAEARPEVIAAQLPFWRERLAGLATVSSLPADRPRPAVQSYSGAEHDRALPDSLRTQVEQQARTAHVTPFMLTLAAFKAQLAAYTGGGDVVVGCPMGARTHPSSRAMIGYFINMTVLRTHVVPAMSLREVLGEVRSTVLDAVENQDVPFDAVVSDLRPDRSLGHNPFFQVLFSFEEDDSRQMRFGEARLHGVVGLPTGAAKFDLTFTVRYGADDLALNLEYATDLFDHATVEAFAADFETSLRAFLADPSTVVGELPLAVRPVPSDGSDAAVASAEPAPYVAASSELEREILAIWSDVLGVSGLGVLDDFFNLGGDSLTASRVIWQVQERYAVTMPVRAFFQDPTIAGFATQVETLLAAARPAGTPAVTPRQRVKLSDLLADSRSEG